MSILNKTIWITWEDHRRSRELADALGVNYQVITLSAPRPIRYLVLSFKTLVLVFRIRPKIIICQNPSIILATLLVLIRSFVQFKLVVDRHTNFKFGTENTRTVKWITFHYLSKFTLRNADLTIVTNEPLARLLESQGAKTFVLEDKLPNLQIDRTTISLEGRFNFLFICTFSNDEPVKEVLEAFNELSEDIFVYVTGNYKKKPFVRDFMHAKNIRFLGFISEIDYLNYLASVDATIVLTKQHYTLNCGSYESVAALKPQIVADTPEIRSYFSMGCVYVSTMTAKEISNSVLRLVENRNRLEQEVERLRSTLKPSWARRFDSLVKYLSKLV